MKKPTLTHLAPNGDARMVNTAAKERTARTAVAEGELHAAPATLDMLFAGTLPKGDAQAAARIAGIMAAKRTPELIPLCHPIQLTSVEVHLERSAPGIVLVRGTAHASDRTGVEMEALTATTVALLTLYDMLKSVQKDCRLQNIRLRRKTGGKSGDLELG